MLDKPSTDPSAGLTMRFEWRITREPDSTVADKVVSGKVDLPILSDDDPGKSWNFCLTREPAFPDSHLFDFSKNR